MQTLSDLSREMPSEDDLLAFPEMLSKEPSHRSGAIMASALVEQALYVAINSRLADHGDVVRSSWFDEANAPFGSFSAKIKLGRALGVYNDKTEARLNTIRNVRNVFAHRSIPIDFSNQTIAAEVMKLRTRETQTDPRMLYFGQCLALMRLLVKDAVENGGKEIEVSLP